MKNKCSVVFSQRVLQSPDGNNCQSQCILDHMMSCVTQSVSMAVAALTLFVHEACSELWGKAGYVLGTWTLHHKTRALSAEWWVTPHG